MSERATDPAAKVNLALVVGPKRPDGLHELVTVMQRVDLRDRLRLRPGPGLSIRGFPEDTLVRGALEALAEAAGVEPRWHADLEKHIPLAAGLGGGSADAAAALVEANSMLTEPLDVSRLEHLAWSLGADVPFFLEAGAKLVEGAGERLTAVDLPRDYWVVLALEEGVAKESTGRVYQRFDELDGSVGFEARRSELLAALGRCRRPRDLAALPKNDLARAIPPSHVCARLLEAGAFRADVSGAGPAVYGLFDRLEQAQAAAGLLGPPARTWVVRPIP